MSSTNNKLATKPLSDAANTSVRQRSTTLRIRSRSRRSGNLLLEMPIGARLTLGFILAALIATIAASFIGAQRSQALSLQSDFYQKLLQTNTSLTTGANFLQLMNTETNTLIQDASVPQPSQETIVADYKALQNLVTLYDGILNGYIQQDLLTKNPDKVALLAVAGHENQVVQQQTLAGSALRTWIVYHLALRQILQDIDAGNTDAVQQFVRVQAEPTNADAQSAVRTLIQFNQHLANSVQDAAVVEEQSQLITTIFGSLLAFIAIVFVGWLITGTLVRRLRLLRQVTQAVEQGHLETRVLVIGRDEIADVSASVNAMLEAIVGLLEESRNQRDVLTNAAEHLFSDMRVVSSGDLRVNAPVSNDPIGMLANAFNFTVGRFRRFVMRTQTTAEQLDVVSRQEMERAEYFAHTLNMYLSTTEARKTDSLSESKEFVRLGQTFAHEIATMARQLAKLAHDMRTSVVSFQLDTPESTAAEPLSNTASLNRGGTTTMSARRIPTK